MGILDNHIVRDCQQEASGGPSFSFARERQDTFSALLKGVSALIESREDQIKIISAELEQLRQKRGEAEMPAKSAAELAALEQRLEEAASREAIWMTVLEWYAAGPFGQRAAAAVALPPSQEAARIRRERELLIAPLLRSESTARDGRTVKISFRDEREAKAFAAALAQFIPAKPYFGLVW
jgi:hypothetical protein